MTSACYLFNCRPLEYNLTANINLGCIMSKKCGKMNKELRIYVSTVSLCVSGRSSKWQLLSSADFSFLAHILFSWQGRLEQDPMVRKHSTPPP